MLLAHKIELRPTAEQAGYLARACGSRRHCYNQLLEHFSQKDVKWSKAAAYQHYMKVIRPAHPWYNEVSSRVTRNAIDDLDNAFKHFFRRVKLGQKPGFPTFKKEAVGVDFGIKSLAVTSDGTVFPENNALKRNLKALKRKQRRLSRKQKGSNRRARAKLAVAKLHKRISDQRQAVLHELSD
ncbi:RNA-guided endonuclease InsQ/TnpB family protein [Thiocapsa imhoffii]|uniref:RNA-guided endonuclease InsQ/TnpB family protein n=1 Tax=Thiocapsa imhoffii TaxID=382777 RepID=UPI001F5BE740|nr:transposase [Thiocapsa imhoffii]